jgi:hypothetical protein
VHLSSTSHTESGLLGEMQLDVGGRPSNLQPGEDKDTLYETPGLSHVTIANHCPISVLSNMFNFLDSCRTSKL